MSERMDGQDASRGQTVGLGAERSSAAFYIGILRRRIWIILAMFVVFLTFGAIRAFRSIDLYEATAKVLIERNTSRLMHFEGVVQSYGGWDPDYYTTQAALLKSRAVMELALERPGVRELLSGGGTEARETEDVSLLQQVRRTLRALLGATPSAPPEPWERLRDQVTTKILPETHFIDVRVYHTRGAYAATLANAAAEAFADFHLQRQADALGDAFAYLKREKDKAERELRNAELALQQFREKAQGVSMSVSEEHRPAYERLTALNQRLTAVQLERSSVLAAMAVLSEIAAGSEDKTFFGDDRLFTLPMIKGDPNLEAIRSGLAQAEQEALRVTGTYGPDHPQYKAFQERIALMRKQFRTTLEQVIGSNSNRLRTLEKEEEEVRRIYDLERDQALLLAKEAFTFTHLQNAVDRYRKLYDALVQRMLEVDVTSGFSQTSVQVVEKADVPASPVNPRRGRKILLAGLFGVFLGCVLGFLVEHLDESIKTPEDLKERLNVPLLGFVPAVDMSSLPEGSDPFSFRGGISLSEPVSSVAEAYRNIRTSIFYSAPADELNVLAVVSCTPEEGKTTTATNLAVTIAQSGKSVLLIDADLHRPAVHRALGIKKRSGLTDVLIGESGWSEVRCRVTRGAEPLENLDVIVAGRSSPNPAELLSSTRMREVLASVRKAYDWVIIDTPPLLFVSDACIVSAICDGVVFVVRAGSAHRSVLSRAKEQLDNVNARIVGSVLNNMVVTRLGRHYSLYYYHGYSRYSKDYQRSYYGDPNREDTAGQPGRDQAQDGE